MDFPGKNIRVSCHTLLQGIFLTQGSNSRLIASPALQVDSLQLVPLGKPHILEQLDLQKIMKMCTDSPYTLHSVFPVIDSCH